MLSKVLIRRTGLALLVAVTLSHVAMAADASPEVGSSADALKYMPREIGSGLPAEERARLQELAREVTRVIQEAESADPAVTREAMDFASQQRRRVDSIADEALAEQRKEALQGLGLDAEEPAALFYFVSWSMPLELLRSYVVDAMWAGGTLVFRGVPPGYDMAQFVTGPMRELVYDKGAHASLSIDPRLFEIYKVQSVPAIVYTQDVSHPLCTPDIQHSFKAGDQELQYTGCHPVDASKYWKMTGAVSTDYALRAFIDDGAQGAVKHHQALARGMREGHQPTKAQPLFTGDWKSVDLPPGDTNASSR